jgi:pyruvate/2-oxoglutarate dehydrogenase complex dihydrolipoamide dehydrogenase (E3) component
MADKTHYDLVILGSGSTAFAAALRAQEYGKTAVMTEERATGGTCVNRGCLPSKNLIEAAKLLHDARHPRYPGISPSKPKLDFRQLIAQKDEVIQQYRNKKNEYLQTNIPHIYAAGDVIGGEQDSQMATPVGSQDGGIAAHNALSGEPPRLVNHRVIPRVIFTDPQVAVVGMTEAEAVAAGHPCWCNAVGMSLVPRAGAIRDTRGFIKMVANAKTDEVLGVTMIGHNAGEVIHEAAMALRFKATLRDFIDLLHVYPTMAEALKIIAISRYKDPAKLSCCAE